MLETLPPGQIAILRKLAGELPYYAKTCLKIVTKAGEVVPFVFNRAQEILHRKIEEQRARTGMVRIVILKGRQLGCSTYVQARYFHQTNFRPNLSAYVLAHQAESTLKIYSITSKFQTNLPPAIKFPLIKNTERSMVIENGSSYSVGTAGSAEIGRGLTIHLLHGSEVAFYENSDQLSTGLLQAVPDVAGTEMIMESTANGPGNWFYDLCYGAIAGKNGFELVFIPWYMDEGYMDPLPLSERELDTKEQQYYEAHKADGLTLHHLSWRRRKISAFGDKEYKFLAEYPFNVDEAFVRAEGRFFNLAKVYAARGRKQIKSVIAPLIVGVDQGRTGDDTKIRRREGSILYPIETIPADDGQERDMRLAGRLAKIIEVEKPDKVFIDTTNEHGALDRLHELGYKQMVKGIHFGEKAIDSERYRNKRTEMYFEFADWIEDSECSIPIDEQRFLSEVGSIPESKETSNSIKYLVSKDDIKKDLGWSPDELDATVLTFAYPVRKKSLGPKPAQTSPGHQKQPWRTQLTTLRGVK